MKTYARVEVNNGVLLSQQAWRIWRVQNRQQRLRNSAIATHVWDARNPEMSFAIFKGAKPWGELST